MVILLLIVIGIVFWVVLQTWYKKKYENYLFENRNNLYNLFNWINEAKKRNISDQKIRAMLKKSGWATEQVKYALKRYSGKRTGMPEIPVDKILKMKKKPRTNYKRPLPDFDPRRDIV